VSPLVNFFVAARNLRQVETTVTYYHPRVEAGIEQAYPATDFDEDRRCRIPAPAFVGDWRREGSNSDLRRGVGRQRQAARVAAARDLGSRSFASSDPAERDLFLQELYAVDGDSWKKRSEEQAILIPAKEIKQVQIWIRKEHEMSRTNDGCKPAPIPNSSIHQPLNPQGGHQPGGGSTPAVPTTGSGVKPPAKP
jgi:Family of unknown function (DUF6338)